MSVLADKFLAELYTPEPPRMRRLPFVIAADQWAAAIADGDQNRASAHAQRMDREVGDFVGLGQAERLRRHLRFE